jgi:hypothetical protein
MFDPAVLGHRNANGFVHNIGTLNDRLLTLRAQAILKAEVPASTTNEARRLESFLDDKQLRFAAYDRRQRRRRADCNKSFTRIFNDCGDACVRSRLR